MHENRGWEGKKQQQQRQKKKKHQKTNRVNFDRLGAAHCAQAAQSSGDIFKKPLVPSPFSFHYISFSPPFHPSIHPPTASLLSFLIFVPLCFSLPHHLPSAFLFSVSP